MNSIEYYNKNAEEFYRDTVNVDMTTVYQPFLELLPENAHILDAGCGSGRDSFYFIKNGYKVIAIDSSEELSKLAEKLINQPVLHITFQRLDFENKFDGIWASASLLHVPRNEIDVVLNRIAKALKQNGVLFTSFKYGSQEYQKEGRYFNCYDENLMMELIDRNQNLEIIKMWTSNDLRPERENEIWLNSLIRKG